MVMRPSYPPVTPDSPARLQPANPRPRSARRLRAAARIPFELAVFAAAVVALLLADAPAAALILAALVAVNATLLTLLNQWDA